MLTDAELERMLVTANSTSVRCLTDSEECLTVSDDIIALVAEVRRLRRGEFTREEFHELCHHLDKNPNCTRADFESGCAAYQLKLFGPNPVPADPVPHASHVWNKTVLNCCIKCEAFHGQPRSYFPCDNSLEGKLEYCCECAGEYPRSDLIDGHIFCPACRAAEQSPRA